jgi:hypothetical protein
MMAKTTLANKESDGNFCHAQQQHLYYQLEVVEVEAI